MSAGPEQSPIAQRLATVKHVILVLSGKGGVGKSSVSVQLALALYASSPTARVGILDVDLTGPSIPRMMGVDGQPVHQSVAGWVPVYADQAEARMACMSVGFLLKRKEDSVVWRGPKKNAMIRQFLSDVRWGDLDYLVVDTPPGTSDEHLSVMEHLAPVHYKLSAVLVTTPQAVALTDMAKCLSFTRTVSLPVIGLIENMSGFVCPCCGEISNVFSTGGGEEMAKREGLRFLGALPVDTELVELLDASVEAEALAVHGADQQMVAARETANGKLENEALTNGHSEKIDTFPLLKGYHKTSTFKLFEPIADKVISALAEEKAPPIRDP